MKILNRSWLVAVVLIGSLILASCSLPFKIVPNVPEEVGITTTQPPSLNDPALTLQPGTPPPSSTNSVTDIKPVAGSVLRWVDLSDFVYVPAGEFIMGEDSTSSTDHSPARSVMLESFWIQQAEVTNQQYSQCVAAGKCTAPNKVSKTKYRYGANTYENFPVVGVSWNQAQEYCTFIEARLPTEAEWEKTARGVEGKTYPWGNNKPACDLLNYDDCLDPSEPEEVRSYPDGTSPFEAMDMAGNVSEWVADWYQNDYYRSAPSANPPGPAEGIEKVYRGGAYASPLADINPVSRFTAKPNEYAADLGFRCVLAGEADALPIPPPACQAPALAAQPDSGPIRTPAPQLVELLGLCNWGADGLKYTSVFVDPPNECTLKRMKDFTINIPGDPLNISCPLVDGLGCADNIFCYSPYFVEGGTYGISNCFDDCNWGAMEPECAQGYGYNTGTGWCEPVSNWLPEPPCPDGYEEFPNIGCLPDHEAFDGCPVGYYTAGINGTYPACMPVAECLLPGAEQPCAAPVCAQGQSYDPENQCCAVPEKWQAICPTGYYFDPDEQMCVQPDWCDTGCQTSSVTIPNCPAPTPTPTLPPCSSFSTENSCPNYCDWVMINYQGVNNYGCR